MYGFHALMTAKPGKGDALVDLLLTGPTSGPASHHGCTVFLISQSVENPDVVHLVEGWASEEIHAEVFASAQAQAYTAKFGELVAESQNTDYVPLGGKAVLSSSDAAR